MYYFERAKCYNKLGKKQEAVTDLNKAIDLKHPKAEKLHEQINPISGGTATLRSALVHPKQGQQE